MFAHIACASPPADGQKFLYANPLPAPTSSYSELQAPLNSQNPTKREDIDGICLRAIQTVINLFNHYEWENYQLYKDIYDEENKGLPEERQRPYMIGKNDHVTSAGCQHYADGKISVGVTTTYLQTVFVIFNEYLNVLSWAFGDINRR